MASSLSQGIPGQKLTLLQPATTLSLMQHSSSLNTSGREMTTASLAGSLYGMNLKKMQLCSEGSGESHRLYTVKFFLQHDSCLHMDYVPLSSNSNLVAKIYVLKPCKAFLKNSSWLGLFFVRCKRQ